MPANVHDADEIISLARGQEEATRPLRDRMESDYRLYRLEPYQEVDGYGDPIEGYRSYTSNAPQVFADKMIQWVARAEFVVRVPRAGRTREQRALDARKERWQWGLLSSVERRMRQRMEPSMRDLTSFHNVVRGVVAGRWLLMNSRSGDTVVDMTVWDPLRTYWGVGAEGLEWACYKTRKTRSEIVAEYGAEAWARAQGDADAWRDGEDADIEVFDYYDREHNIVVAGNGAALKPATPHGAERPPVVIVPVGATPLVQTDAAIDAIADYGESVFKANRGIYDKHNLMMSIYLELAARARRPPLGVRSRDGRKTLEEDPYQEGTTISMTEHDEIQPFPLLQTTQDAANLTGQISGEVQRGSIPHSVYGELQFELSGFAINTLRSGLDSLLRPRLIAEGAFYAQGLELLAEQYASGRFAPLSARAFSGADLSPADAARAGTPEVKLEGDLPEDETAKFTQARIAREGDFPLLPDRWIYDNILKIRDAENIEQSVGAQVARRGTPESALLTSLKAASDQGDDDYARLYEAELRIVRARKLLELRRIRDGASKRAPGELPASPDGADADGAQRGDDASSAERLEAMGLVAGRG